MAFQAYWVGLAMIKLTESAFELFEPFGYNYVLGCIQRGHMQCAPTVGNIVNLLQGGTKP